MSKQVEIKIGDHFANVGSTGTGKTVFTRELVSQMAYAGEGFIPVYILDTKGQIDAPEKSDFKDFFRPGIGKRYTGNAVPPVINPKGKDFFQVWTPLVDDLEMYNEYFKGIYQAKRPAIVLVDELSSVSKNRGSVTRYHNILHRQGRGLGISVINNTQSPTFVGETILREIMHLVKFRVNNPMDNKKLSGYMGREVEKEPIDPYGFYYRNVTVPTAKQRVTYYKNMQEFFGLE